MVQKSVSDLILDKFAESIKKDDLFVGISDELTILVREKRHSKSGIEKLLKGKQDEDSESGS